MRAMANALCRVPARRYSTHTLALAFRLFSFYTATGALAHGVVDTEIGARLYGDMCTILYWLVGAARARGDVARSDTGVRAAEKNLADEKNRCLFFSPSRASAHSMGRASLDATSAPR